LIFFSTFFWQNFFQNKFQFSPKFSRFYLTTFRSRYNRETAEFDW
jgi:hypothetical protein